MKSPTIYKCSADFAKAWWVPLEKAGFTVERLPDRGIVKLANAKVAVHPLADGHLMLVFKASVFSRKNLRLAQQVDEIFSQHSSGSSDRVD